MDVVVDLNRRRRSPRSHHAPCRNLCRHTPAPFLPSVGPFAFAPEAFTTPDAFATTAFSAARAVFSLRPLALPSGWMAPMWQEHLVCNTKT